MSKQKKRLLKLARLHSASAEMELAAGQLVDKILQHTIAGNFNLVLAANEREGRLTSGKARFLRKQFEKKTHEFERKLVNSLTGKSLTTEDNLVAVGMQWVKGICKSFDALKEEGRHECRQ